MRKRLALPLALLLALPACSLLPERPKSPALHDFGPAGKTLAAAPGAWSAAAVDAPEWLQTENIRYRLLYAEPTRVRAYAQDRWLAPPPALLAQRLALSQGAAGVRLKIKLLEFEQVFDSPQNAKAILAFRATALQPDNDTVLAEKVFQFAQATPEANAQGAVSGFSTLIGQAVNALQTWLAEANVRR
jgi:cholesterol transport system auxiliary component